MNFYPKNDKSSVIITGACGGIGRQLVDQFTMDGYRVIAIDKSEKVFDLENCEKIQFDLFDFAKDELIRKRESGRIFDAIYPGKLKAIINNAAEQVVKPIEEVTFEDWHRTLTVNVIAPFMLIQNFLHLLESSKGTVVNISSIHARLTKPNFAVYATSKSALSGLTRLLSVELGSRIRVNAIEPGAISTQMLESGFAGEKSERMLLDQFHPTQRIGKPYEITSLASYLVSSDASFINGSIISIDGGISNALLDPSNT